MNPSSPAFVPCHGQKSKGMWYAAPPTQFWIPAAYRRRRQMAESPYKMTTQSETHPAQSCCESQSKCLRAWTLAESLMCAIVFVVARCREWFEWALVRQEAPGRLGGSPGSCKHYNLDVDHRDSPLLSLHYTVQTTMPLQNFFAEETCAHFAATPRLGVNTTGSIGAPSSGTVPLFVHPRTERGGRRLLPWQPDQSSNFQSCDSSTHKRTI